MKASEILFGIPTQIEIAEAINAAKGQHKETVRRMATAIDLLRGGGWELVKVKAKGTAGEIEGGKARPAWCAPRPAGGDDYFRAEQGSGVDRATPR